ncbi:amidohydrolase family protein [Micromonospora sp. M12]
MPTTSRTASLGCGPYAAETGSSASVTSCSPRPTRRTWIGRTFVGDRGGRRRRPGFDLLVRQHQLPMAARLTRDLSEVSFVLDHLGKPALGLPEMAEWSRDLRALAASPNTSAKLSGLVTEVQLPHWTPGDLRPAVDDALDAFGPDRLMFGSDWPVCLLASSYPRWVDALAELLAEHDAASQARIWGDTARRVYRLAAS